MNTKITNDESKEISQEISKERSTERFTESYTEKPRVIARRTSKKKAEGMSKKAIAMLAVSALSLNLLAGCGTKTVTAPPAPAAVKVQTVQMAPMPSGEVFLGTVTPYVQTMIAPSISGILSSVNVRVGDKVEEGELLATVNTDLLSAQLNQALASRELAQVQQEATSQKLDSSIKQADAGVNAAQINLNNATAGAESSIAVAEKSLEALQTQLDNQVAAAEKAVAAAEAQLANTRAMKENAVDQAERAVASAESNLEAIRAQNQAVLDADQKNIDTLNAALEKAEAQLDAARQAGDATTIASVQEAVNQLEISLANAQGKLEIDRANSGLKAAENALNTAETALDAAENSEAVAAAEKQVNQAEQALANAKAARDSELEKARASLEATKTGAANTVKGASAQLAQAQTVYEDLLSDKQLEVSEAQVKAAQAGVQTLQVQIDKGRLTSPIQGYVVAVNAQVGQAVGPQGGFITISSMNPLLAAVEVPESSIAKIKQGLNMTVFIPATGETVPGKVAAIHPAPDMNKKYLIEVELTGNKQELISGMRVEAYAAAEGAKGILIPGDSVVTLKSGAYSVFVVEDGVARNRIVKVGRMTGSVYEITSGLAEGEVLVVQGQNLLSDGDKVQAVGQEEQTSGDGIQPDAEEAEPVAESK
ncbi:efflux RND transporter periplasmic adaptor subunit [Paradesulfitobacterium ferrireducens]|uniref:efflux RND transporter periplasmic adaptor subunit n=1 Tax=Paradesulfitobacterium ferrireducens TaxID=2816476 RepID=UPI001A8DA163|nr:efflux RND transporter periplasmic adaptor subunit [Paradesulfitobacterium ferrireducens]